MGSLTKAQRDVLNVFSLNQSQRNPPSVSEVGFILGHRLREWARGPIYSLLKGGLVESTGTGRIPQTWRITDAGRQALEESS